MRNLQEAMTPRYKTDANGELVPDEIVIGGLGISGVRSVQDGQIAAGQGIAFAQYENDQAIVATVVDLQVNPVSGEIRVQRVVVAHDCGLIINPDGVKNQIEGNVIQSCCNFSRRRFILTAERLISPWGWRPLTNRS